LRQGLRDAHDQGILLVEGFEDLVASDLLARQDPADHHLRRVEGCALGGFLAQGPASQSPRDRPSAPAAAPGFRGTLLCFEKRQCFDGVPRCGTAIARSSVNALQRLPRTAT
jgi:hypothetical protein